MAMKTIDSVDALSVAKIQGVIAAALGLIVGVIYAVILSAMPYGGMMGSGAQFGILSIVIFPIMYAIVGFLGGGIAAFIYNIVAKNIGGIKIELS